MIVVLSVSQFIEPFVLSRQKKDRQASPVGRSNGWLFLRPKSETGHFSTSSAGFAWQIMSAFVPKADPKVAAKNWGVATGNRPPDLPEIIKSNGTLRVTRVSCLAVVPSVLRCACLSARQHRAKSVRHFAVWR